MVCINDNILFTLKLSIMLAKLNLLFPAVARQERVTQQRALTHKQWINADRVVMALLFLSVIAGAIIFS